MARLEFLATCGTPLRIGWVGNDRIGLNKAVKIRRTRVSAGKKK
jgi:hypothetical protein